MARALTHQKNAVLLVQDEFLERLYPGETVDIPGFVKCSALLRAALGSHVHSLLLRGTSVVLDFPGNTKMQREWFRSLYEGAKVGHELHFIDVPDEICKLQPTIRGVLFIRNIQHEIQEPIQGFICIVNDGPSSG